MQAAQSDLVPPPTRPLDGRPAGSQGRLRAVGYWVFTLIIALEMTAGSLWDLLRIEFVRGVFARLGYPVYLLLILGVWKLPCAAALLAPGLPRLKEWAYAGAFFLYAGAAASHFLAGEGARQVGGPGGLRALHARLFRAPPPTTGGCGSPRRSRRRARLHGSRWSEGWSRSSCSRCSRCRKGLRPLIPLRRPPRASRDGRGPSPGRYRRSSPPRTRTPRRRAPGRPSRRPRRGRRRRAPRAPSGACLERLDDRARTVNLTGQLPTSRPTWWRRPSGWRPRLRGAGRPDGGPPPPPRARRGRRRERRGRRRRRVVAAPDRRREWPPRRGLDGARGWRAASRHPETDPGPRRSRRTRDRTGRAGRTRRAPRGRASPGRRATPGRRRRPATASPPRRRSPPLVSAPGTPSASSRRALRERSMSRHTRATTVVSQPSRFPTALESEWLTRSHAS